MFYIAFSTHRILQTYNPTKDARLSPSERLYASNNYAYLYCADSSFNPSLNFVQKS